jgi:hypothetical protein
MRAIRFFEAVNGGDVGMIERGQQLSFTLEAGEALRIARETSPGKSLRATSRSSLESPGAIDLAHPALANQLADHRIVPACARCQRHLCTTVRAARVSKRVNAA